MRSIFSTWQTKNRDGKMLPAVFVFVATSCIGFLGGCVNSKPTPQLSDDVPMIERNKGNEVHGEVGVMYGNNLGRR
jgi:hypothetical protein